MSVYIYACVSGLLLYTDLFYQNEKTLGISGREAYMNGPGFLEIRAGTWLLVVVLIHLRLTYAVMNTSSQLVLPPPEGAHLHCAVVPRRRN